MNTPAKATTQPSEGFDPDAPELAQCAVLCREAIESVTNWIDDGRLVTAHAHATVLAEDLPAALQSNDHPSSAVETPSAAACECEALRAKNEKLRAALEPFASVNTAGWNDDAPVDEMDGLTATHLRSARQALHAGEAK